MQRKWPKDSYECVRQIEEALQKNDVRQSQRGLAFAYDFFVESVLGDRYEDVIALGRELATARILSSYQSEGKTLDIEVGQLLGQIKALIELTAYVSRRMLPSSSWQAVNRSKYSKPIMAVLFQEGATLASDLCGKAGLKCRSELSPTIQPLLGAGLVRQERYGKNIQYSLTSAGRVLATKLFAAKDVDSVVLDLIPILLKNLASGPHDLAGLLKELNTVVQYAKLEWLVGEVLFALWKGEVVKQEGGVWEIALGQVEQEGVGDYAVTSYIGKPEGASLIPGKVDDTLNRTFNEGIGADKPQGEPTFDEAQKDEEEIMHDVDNRILAGAGRTG